MVNDAIAVKYGVLTLMNICSSVWLGDWDQYEKVVALISKDLKDELPFSSYYDRDEVDLWYQNHFYIPGDYFVSPYFSTYFALKYGDYKVTNKELLCLIGTYQKVGFYFPLEKKNYPDHIGCLNTFVESILKEEITALKKNEKNYLNSLNEMKMEFVNKYLVPLQSGIQTAALNKIKHPFLIHFLNFYSEFIEKDLLLTI